MKAAASDGEPPGEQQALTAASAAQRAKTAASSAQPRPTEGVTYESLVIDVQAAVPAMPEGRVKALFEVMLIVHEMERIERRLKTELGDEQAAELLASWALDR